MPERQDATEDASEVLRRNIEQSRRLIEEKKKAHSRSDNPRPDRTGPHDAADGVPPGQPDVPQGGSSGQEMGGGSAHRRERHSG